MEKLSFEFTQALSAHADIQVFANRKGKRALTFFLPQAARYLRAHAQTADVVHLGDALLSILLPFIPRKGKRPMIAVTIHGLDLRYRNSFYQALLRRFLPRIDLALCISRFVEQEFHQRFPHVQTLVMNPGLDDPSEPQSTTRSELRTMLQCSVPEGVPLLLAVARLVPRKGLAWFIERVLPFVPNAHLLIIGSGPEAASITSTTERVGMAGRVTLAGHQPQETLIAAYRAADFFVMPNIPVRGDAEGFGLVALEAASAGLPVVAADLEGIPDAVVENETGILVPPLDAVAWIETLQKLLASPQAAQIRARAPQIVRAQFLWDARIRAVLTKLQELSS